MGGIFYDANLDFIFYLDIMANSHEIREQSKREEQLSAVSRNKAVEKRQEEFLKETESYYKNLNFMQRNMIELFFHRTRIAIDFLLKLALKEKKLEDQTIEDFKNFCAETMEMESFQLDYDYIYHHVEDYFGSPDSYVDYEKASNLIIDFVKDPSIFEENFKQTVENLKTQFIKDKIEPIKETIQEKIEAHQKLYDKKPQDFLKNLTAGKINNADIGPEPMSHYVLFYAPMQVLISLSTDKVTYGVELENLAPKESIADLHVSLFKFLSDPKRYKMIKMLSKKKWYSNELAKEFNITPATMSYHVNKLYTLGLIQFDKGEQNKLYLELDKDRLNYLLSQIKDDLTTF